MEDNFSELDELYSDDEGFFDNDDSDPASASTNDYDGNNIDEPIKGDQHNGLTGSNSSNIDFGYGNNNDDNNHNNSYDDDDEDNEKDWIDHMLESKGIVGRSISFENEDGTSDSVLFDELSDEEKINIINYNPDREEAPSVSNEDIELLNFIKENNIIERFVEMNENNDDDDDNVRYSVDDYSDEEIFLAHLTNEYPELTDEELAEELNTQKEDEEKFNKKASALREKYTELEKQRIESDEREREEEYLSQLSQSNEMLGDAINNSSDISDYIELEEEDLDFLYDYLQVNNEGISDFDTEMKDHENIIKAALYFKKGDEIIGQLMDINNQLRTELDKKNKNNDNIQSAPRTGFYVSDKGKKKQQKPISFQDELDALVEY